MKVFITVCVIALAATALALTDEQKKIVEENEKKCADKTHVSAEDLANYQKGVFSDKPEMYNFVFCFMNSAGLVDEKGNPNRDAIAEKVLSHHTKEEASKIIDACKVDDKETKEHKALQLLKCYHEQEHAKTKA